MIIPSYYFFFILNALLGGAGVQIYLKKNLKKKIKKKKLKKKNKKKN